MKKIQIFGGGCAKCGILYQHAEAAAKELGIEYEIEKVSDYEKIAEAGIMATPALAVDGKVKLEGRVPGVESLKALLK
ncbi:MAG: redox-active disulfide protein 2 [Elusimicrobia bacterium GWC2_64_44]|nr:MAG: redox-active disulfide protein 2 [Elusimicrobia bacterium GWC2_64_44]